MSASVSYYYLEAYAENLHSGIDLKLPPDYRAVVTLGANLTKDRLVQACMRMRKLGKSQSVVFCVSEKIRTKIDAIKDRTHDATITVSDVIHWAITETCAEIRRSMPLWATQGERFVRHNKLWRDLNINGKATLLDASRAAKFLEKEAESIEARYRPQRDKNLPAYLTQTSDADVVRIADRCRQFDNLQFNASSLQEEQERELSPEIEEERQVQRALAASPARHTLHQDVRNFAFHGTVKTFTSAYTTAWVLLTGTSAASLFPISVLAKDMHLLATTDFATTVTTTSSKNTSDIFQRPVQWLLTKRSPSGNHIVTVMAISPYEANVLYPLMKNAKSTSLHLYKPRSNLGYAPLDCLDFHIITGQPSTPTIPRALAVQLNLFAGQLYITSHEDYMEICDFLGLAGEITPAGWKVDVDGFILEYAGGQRPRLPKSPNTFLKVMISKVRRNGEGITRTHMGALLDGKLFVASDFEA